MELLPFQQSDIQNMILVEFLNNNISFTFLDMITIALDGIEHTTVLVRKNFDCKA